MRKAAAAGVEASQRDWLAWSRVVMHRGLRALQDRISGLGSFPFRVDQATHVPGSRTVAGGAVGWRRRARHLTDRWRRSLQLRVITATLVLSAVVVTMLGYVLLQHFVAGLYANKREASENIALAGLGVARDGQFSQHPNTESAPNMWHLVTRLESAGGTQYEVAITVKPRYQGPPVYSSGAEEGFYLADRMPLRLPSNLVSLVEHEGQNGPLLQGLASVAVGTSGRPVPGLVFGAPFGSAYDLYYFFPLAAEQQSITSMERTMLLVGIAAVFLLVAIAWLVVRWVVVPVRLAAQGARRLSTGALSERMEVRGSDELAALATAFNDMAASLQEKIVELEDLSQVQRQFVSDVSHELRTPLTTIRIASDVLLGAKDSMEQAAGRSAELLQSQLERFESLLTDLLEISRYDANAATLDAEAVDICDIVRQSADVAQQLAERRGTKIEFRLPANPCVAEVDRRRVERILRNLLLNAVEHGEDKGTVVSAAMDSGAVAVSVRDFGVGLRPGEEQLVFDRFWRADPARARTSGGTGLGLAIALEDARLHAGWLEAWGEPGRGSVFRLTLPRAVGGELHGSPLPLSPPSADLAEQELPGLASLTEQPSLGELPAGAGAVAEDDAELPAGAGAADTGNGPADIPAARHPAAVQPASDGGGVATRG